MFDFKNKANIVVLWETNFPLLFVEKEGSKYYMYCTVKNSIRKKQAAYLKIKVSKEELNSMIEGKIEIRGLFGGKEVYYVEHDKGRITETNMELDNELIGVVNLDIVKKIFENKPMKKEELFPPKELFLNDSFLMNKMELEVQKEFL